MSESSKWSVLAWIRTISMVITMTAMVRKILSNFEESVTSMTSRAGSAVEFESSDIPRSSRSIERHCSRVELRQFDRRDWRSSGSISCSFLWQVHKYIENFMTNTITWRRVFVDLWDTKSLLRALVVSWEPALCRFVQSHSMSGSFQSTPSLRRVCTTEFSLAVNTKHKQHPLKFI